MIPSKLCKYFFVCTVCLTILSCGLVQDISSSPSEAAPTTNPPTYTPKSLPPKSSPTPVIAKENATFSGLLEISKRGTNASADSGEIEFVTSADGSMIESLSYTLVNGKCSYEAAGISTTITGSGKSTLFFNKPVLITNGKFSFTFMNISASGTFIAPTEAHGIISINQEESISSPNLQKFTCNYGIWDWQASVK